MNAGEASAILAKYPAIVGYIERFMKIAPEEGTIDICPATAEWFSAGTSEEDLTRLAHALTHHFAPRYVFYWAFDWIG